MLPEKTADSISQTLIEAVDKKSMSNCISMVGGNASRRESIKEPQTDREIVNARADSKKNTAVNFRVLGCVVLISLLLAVFTTLHSQPKVFAIHYLVDVCFNIFVFAVIYANYKLISIGFSKL